MNSDKELEIKPEQNRRNEHLNLEKRDMVDKTISKLESSDNLEEIDFQNCSEHELLKASEKNSLNEDKQYLRYNKFFTIASNFASAKLNDKLKNVPITVEKIKDLVAKMKKEIKEFGQIATQFEEIIIMFVKIFMATKHNLNMIKPYLECTVLHLTVLEEASKCEIYNDIDKDDCTKAFDSLVNEINKLQEMSKNTKKDSGALSYQIQELKKQCVENKSVEDRQVQLRENKNNWTVISLNGISGLIEKYNPIAYFKKAPTKADEVFIGTIEGIIYLIKYLSDTHQEKALEYLIDILSYLDELQNFYPSFMDLMKKTEEKDKTIMTDFISINDWENGQICYRKSCSDLCDKAIVPTKTLIKIIDEIDKIKLSSLSYLSKITDN